MRSDDSAPSVPRPPAFHWIFVLLLSVVTVGIFADLWLIVQAVWVRKFDRSSKALYLGLGAIALTPVELRTNSPISALILIAAIVFSVVASFSVRDSLVEYITSVERTPTYLSGVMTIFLGSIYLQYHMNRVRSFQRHASLAGAH